MWLLAVTLVLSFCTGRGFDRHLFVLRTLAEEAGHDLDIFKDPSYQHLNHVIVSTSTLSANHVLIGGFAPVTPDGYSIGYNVSTHFIIICMHVI